MKTQHRLASLLTAAAVAVTGTALVTGHAATLQVNSAKIDTFSAAQPAPTTTTTAPSGPVLVDVTDSDSSAGPTDGRFATGDWIEFHVSAPLDPATLPSTVSVVLADAPGNSGPDTMTMAGVLATTTGLGSDAYFDGKNKGAATFSASAVQLTTGGTRIRVTLGACSGLCGAELKQASGNITFTLSTSIKAPNGASVTGSKSKPSMRLF